MLLCPHECLPFVPCEIRQAVSKRHIHQPFLHDARPVRQGNGIAQLNQDVIIVILRIFQEIFQELLLSREAVISRHLCTFSACFLCTALLYKTIFRHHKQVSTAQSPQTADVITHMRFLLQLFGAACPARIQQVICSPAYATGIFFSAHYRFFLLFTKCLIIGLTNAGIMNFDSFSARIRERDFMNMNLTAKYLQYLRKSRHFTQEDLAKRLDISRQAVSKWETGTTMPDLEVLLMLSKLYGVTINDILEPRIQPPRITDFEQISTMPEKELREILEQFDGNCLATALMGASPETNSLCRGLFPDMDFEKIQREIGRTRIETVEDMQKQIISMINLHSAIPDDA